MNEIKKAQRIINIMTDNNYLPYSSEVLSVELTEDNNINVVFTYNDCEDYENFVVPLEVWKLDSDKVIEHWVDLLIEAEKEQYNPPIKDYIVRNPMKVQAIEWNNENINLIKRVVGEYKINANYFGYFCKTTNRGSVFVNDGDMVVVYPTKDKYGDLEIDVFSKDNFNKMFKPCD